MTTKNTLTPEIQNKIEEDMVRGYYNEEGIKTYPKLTEAAEWYNVSYDSLKQKARTWNWKQRRKNYQNKVKRKVAEKKKDEEVSESEAEEIVVNDYKFNQAANKLRRAAVKELDNILDGKITKSVGYHLMNIGKSLESAQKISKTAAGEPSEISETNVKSKGKYEVTKKIICSKDHIDHELSVLNAASEAQGCNK